MQARILLIVVVGIAGRVVAGDLISEQVPAAVLANTNMVPFVFAQRETTLTMVAAPERWAKFEVEFGIQQLSPSLVKGSLQNAKYQLDRATFTLQEFVDTVRNRLQFDYGMTTPVVAARRGSTGNLFTDTLTRARLQSALDLKLGAKSFFGVKLVLPLGD